MKTNRDLSGIKRVVVKIGSSSITHKESGGADLIRIEKLVRELSDLRNRGFDVILVSSGAISVGINAAGIKDLYYDGNGDPEHPDEKLRIKQAAAAIGQARLMMIYQRIFAEYNQLTAQVLMTKRNVKNNLNRFNVTNTFEELLNLGAIPVVNENDSISTYEIKFGDNDTLSAIVASITKADLLILLSDIDGLYTNDPRKDPDAEFIPYIDKLTDEYDDFAKGSTGSSVGTGGMATKIQAAHIATSSGANMVIANAKNLDVIHEIINGENVGTWINANADKDFYLSDYFEDD
ncbi:glutamate 5-kinase [Lachnospiraceae bacterium KH1T2]|nr:glutamate 5-kinase [Lachnospiraceae bacterium KH1T2]